MPGPSRSRLFRRLALIELALLAVAAALWLILSRIGPDGDEGSHELGMEQSGGFCACFLDGSVPIRVNGNIWSIDNELALDLDAALKSLGERVVRARTEPEEGDGPRLYLVFSDESPAREAWAAIRRIAENVGSTTLRLTTGDRWWTPEDWGAPILLAGTFEMDPAAEWERWPTARLELALKNDAAHVTTDLARAHDGPLRTVAPALVEALEISEDNVGVQVAGDVSYGDLRRLAARFADADFTLACLPTLPGGELRLFGWPSTSILGRRALRGLTWPVARSARTNLWPDEEVIESVMGLDRIVFIRGREMKDQEDLENHLWRRADASRDVDPPHASKIFLGLTADARLPWRDPGAKLRVAASRNVRIRHLLIQARQRPDGPRGWLRALLPVHGENLHAPSFLRVALSPGDSESRVRAVLAEGGGSRVMVSATGDVPFGEVVRAMDVILADGNRSVTLALSED